jgi:outer membrane protein
MSAPPHARHAACYTLQRDVLPKEYDMRKTIIVAMALSVAGAAPYARADGLIELYGGVGLWNGVYDGDVRAGITEIDFDDDLSISRDSHLMIYAGFEHPVPLLPNVRAQYVRLDASDSSVLARTIGFRGVQFPAGTTIDSRIDLTQIDGTLYYKLWDTGFEFDLGVTLRYVEGLVDIAAENQQARAEFDGFLPMAHAAVRVALPITGLWAGARVDGTGWDGDRLIDATFSAGWQSAAGIGIEGGWRLYRLEIDERGDFEQSTIHVSGPYAALNFRF